MATQPKFSRGQGTLTASVLNEIIDQGERNRHAIEILKTKRPIEEPLDPRFIAQILGRTFDPLLSLDQAIGWAQVLIRSDGILIEPTASKRSSRSEPPGNDFQRPGFVLTPPNGLMMAMHDELGGKQYAWMPLASVLMAKVVSVIGGPNATYEIQTVDDAINVVVTQPIDRWAGVTYVAKAPGDDCLMLITDDTVAGLKMVGFETPEFAQCPPAALSGVSSSSFIGL